MKTRYIKNMSKKKKVARPIAFEAWEAIKPSFEGIKRTYCGSLRRGERAISDIDIIAVDTIPMLDIIGRIKRSRTVKDIEIISSGEKRTIMLVSTKACKRLQVDIMLVPKSSWGAAMLHATGSGDFNIGMRSYAKKQGFLLNQYGLFERETGVRITGGRERDIFRVLGMQWVPPKERNDFYEAQKKYKAKPKVSSGSYKI